MSSSLLDQPETARNSRPATVEAYLLGQVEFARCLELQRRLIYETHTRADGRITLLLCEHPPIVTIGRGGSRDDLALRSVLLAGRPVDVVRVNRGGGAILHLPGHLAVYAIAPLDWHDWTAGEYMRRFQRGLAAALAALDTTHWTRDGRHGVWGRTGQLVSIGVGVRNWITYFGAQIYVAPTMHLDTYVDIDPVDHTPTGSLTAEADGRSVRMSRVRARVVRSVSEAFGCPSYHPYTGHPLLPTTREYLP